jgi:predicted small lipoprotein YifL
MSGSFRALVVVALALFLAGCGKKETPPAPPAANGAPNTPGSPQNAAAAIPPEETIANERSIDYLKGLIAKKLYPQAREMVQFIGSKRLTPAQQKAFNDLKAQVPPA